MPLQGPIYIWCVVLHNRIHPTAGVHQPEVVWPRSTACLCALNAASIFSEMSSILNRDIHSYSQRFYLSPFFLTITFFVLKSTMKWKRVKYTSNRSVHILAGWKANNKWPNAHPLCVVPSCPHSLPDPILTSKRFKVD